MTNERTLIAALVADMASAHDECLEGWHESARDTLLGAMQAGNAFLATPADTAAPFAWYSPRHGDTLTDKQKTERAVYVPLDAAAYSVPLFTAAPVAPAEQSHAVSYMEGISDGRAEVKPADPITDWHACGMDYAYTEATDPSASDDWATDDIAKAFEAGARLALRSAHGIKP